MTEARKQFRPRRRGPAVLSPKPRLSAELRERYLQPIIPWQMHDLPLAPLDGMIFGLLGRPDLEGYASHFETGVPWYTSQGPWLASIAPPTEADPLVKRRGRERTVRWTERGRDGQQLNRRSFTRSIAMSCDGSTRG